MSHVNRFHNWHFINLYIDLFVSSGWQEEKYVGHGVLIYKPLVTLYKLLLIVSFSHRNRAG